MQQLTNSIQALTAAQQSMSADGLTHDVADGHLWVEATVWILKDHLHVATHASQFTLVELQ
jgi:hypothetical protein